ncbi:crossover junction endodeoxyribonuclease RuvC [Thermanaerovibrio velox DSM 12556]|uniref:Crossover junction endodeoxyribonuclease RuvC n=1 Tax=Thermanaerovibrio velox DSM 12556 TaxID=926567 RepID=H0URW3_9BACT|nr:crossover junction endodeoxyribonuclease RuvC [Thermanaerovibrio velox]EHM10052.1 crossover junction endodeoxyribonuclease RuvC [Thermanaerovibrio velox DSM 12556]
MPSDEIRCLGIDPGIGTLGYGIVVQRGSELRAEGYGAIHTPPGLSLPERLKMLYRLMDERLSMFAPHLVAVERLYFGRNTTTAEMVWQARGVVLLYASMMGVPVIEPGPSEVKMAVCGYGGAQKRQVQLMVRCLLGLEACPTPDDVADALAVAIAGLAMGRLTCVGGLRIDKVR